MVAVRERFSPVPMAADSTYVIAGNVMGGFLAKTTGTITVVGKDASGTSDVTYVNAVPVTAGIFTPIPIMFRTQGGATVTLAGGASGTLMI